MAGRDGSSAGARNLNLLDPGSPAARLAWFRAEEGEAADRGEGLLDDRILEVGLEFRVGAQQRGELRCGRQVAARHGAQREARHRHRSMSLPRGSEHLMSARYNASASDEGRRS